MHFKKIYIEITNICNMNCPFCKTETRPKQQMNVADFKHIINIIKPYQNGIYLHVKGEPLLHPDLDRILTIADENNININITTNGTLLKNKSSILLNHKCVRQINISLHSNLNNDEYLKNIFNIVEKLLANNIYVNYRLWNLYEKSNIKDKINDYYNTNIDKTNIIKNHLFIEMEHVFNWPTLNNTFYNENGKCYGLINQIAILVNGDVVPCCLDSESIMKLGNIFIDDFASILNSERVQNIIAGFKKHKKVEELCKHCNFYNERK